MPNHQNKQIIDSLMDYWEESSTLKSYIGRFLQDLTFIEIQKNMNIAFKQEPGHLRKYERIEIFIKLCHSQIYQKEH